MNSLEAVFVFSFFFFPLFSFVFVFSGSSYMCVVVCLYETPMEAGNLFLPRASADL